MNCKKLFAAAALGLTLTTAAHATVVTIYTDKAAWQAAVGGFSTEDFADATLLPGLSITGGHSISAGRLEDVLATGEVTTYSFTSGLAAFGGNFDLTAGGAGTGLALTLDGGATINFALPQEIDRFYAGGFFGFTSDTAFTSVAFRMGTQAIGQETYAADDIVISASAAEVPEPGSLALLGLGLAGLAVARKRKQA